MTDEQIREMARRFDEHILANLRVEREAIKRRWRYLAEKTNGGLRSDQD